MAQLNCCSFEVLSDLDFSKTLNKDQENAVAHFEYSAATGEDQQAQAFKSRVDQAGRSKKSKQDELREHSMPI
jgi:hypothetical protein